MIFTVGFPIQGAPGGGAPKMVKGVISSLKGVGDNPSQIQIDAPVLSGNYGGPLLNEKGDIVGVVCAKASDKEALAKAEAGAQCVNHALKASYLKAFLTQEKDVSNLLVTSGVDALSTFEKTVQKAEKSAVLVTGYRQTEQE